MYRDRNQRDFARKPRREMTGAEHRLWMHLRRGQIGGVKFRRQAAIGRYVVDFVAFEAKLAIELDGGQHNSPVERARDAERTAWLNVQGYRVLRFWNYQVTDDLDGVVEAIAMALGESFGGASPLP